MKPLILASASPRRRELLSLITTDFSVQVSDVDEILPEGIAPQDAVALLAERKARAVAKQQPDAAVIGSDTVVALEGLILGKPADRDDAARMLRLLSGKTHQVYTGVCVVADGKAEVLVSFADVTFAPMSEEEILSYAASGEPDDKAGAYAIQGLGARFISRVAGDYCAVVGLPVQPLYRMLCSLSLV